MPLAICNIKEKFSAILLQIFANMKRPFSFCWFESPSLTIYIGTSIEFSDLVSLAIFKKIIAILQYYCNFTITTTSLFQFANKLSHLLWLLILGTPIVFSDLVALAILKNNLVQYYYNIVQYYCNLVQYYCNLVQ